MAEPRLLSAEHGRSGVYAVVVGVAGQFIGELHRGVTCRRFRLAPIPGHRVFTHEVVVEGVSRGQALVPVPLEHVRALREWVGEGAAGACGDAEQRFALQVCDAALSAVSVPAEDVVA